MSSRLLNSAATQLVPSAACGGPPLVLPRVLGGFWTRAAVSGSVLFRALILDVAGCQHSEAREVPGDSRSGHVGEREGLTPVGAHESPAPVSGPKAISRPDWARWLSGREVQITALLYCSACKSTSKMSKTFNAFPTRVRGKLTALKTLLS